MWGSSNWHECIRSITSRYPEYSSPKIHFDSVLGISFPFLWSVARFHTHKMIVLIIVLYICTNIFFFSKANLLSRFRFSVYYLLLFPRRYIFRMLQVSSHFMLMSTNVQIFCVALVFRSSRSWAITIWSSAKCKV